MATLASKPTATASSASARSPSRSLMSRYTESSAISPVRLGGQQTSASGRAWRRRGSCRRATGWRCRPSRRRGPRRPTSRRTRCRRAPVSVTASAPSGVSTSTMTSSGASVATCSRIRSWRASPWCTSVGRNASRSGAWSARRDGIDPDNGAVGIQRRVDEGVARRFPVLRRDTVLEVEDHHIGCGRGLFESLRAVGRAEQPAGPVVARLFRSSRARCATTRPPQVACAPSFFAMRSPRRRRAGCGRCGRR